MTQEVLLVKFDKNINDIIIKYIVNDLKISFKNLKVLLVKGNKKNKKFKNLLFNIRSII